MHHAWNCTPVAPAIWLPPPARAVPVESKPAWRRIRSPHPGSRRDPVLALAQASAFAVAALPTDVASRDNAGLRHPAPHASHAIATVGYGRHPLPGPPAVQ